MSISVKSLYCGDRREKPLDHIAIALIAPSYCKHGYICLVQNLNVTGLASPLVASAFSRKILSLRPSPKHPSTRKGEKSTSVTQGTQRTEWFCILILRRNVVSTIKQRTLSVQAVPGAFFFTQQTTVTIITAVFQRLPCVFPR